MLATRTPITLLAALTALAIAATGCNLGPSAEITITWTTESELDVVGFNLYRADSPDGPFAKVNEHLIRPSDDPFRGGRYEYIDGDVEIGRTYYYQLETLDRQGASTRTEPIAVSAGP